MISQSEGPAWVMRVLISLIAFILVFLVGAKTEWLTVSRAAQTTNEDRVQNERAYEALVLGKTRPDATSGELIDAAVTRGEISSQQGLLYGVYLACGDPRLPERFRGQDLEVPARDILWEADVDWAALPPDIQQALHAFFTGAPAAEAASTCAEDIARLRHDPSVWWAAALQEQPPLPVAASIE